MREISGKTQVIAVALVTALCMLGDSMLYVVLPVAWKEAGLSSLWEVGILLSVNRLIRVPLGPLVGKWYERSGGRKGLVIAVGLAFVTTLSYGLQGFWLLLLMRCLWGVAWTFLRLGAFSLIVSVAQEHNRGRMMGLYNGLYRLGSLGGMMAGAIFATWYGLAAASVVLALCSVIALVLVFLYIRPSFTSMHTALHAKRAEKSWWRQRTVLVTLGTGFVIAMVYQGMFTSTLSRLIELRYPVTMIGGVAIGAAIAASLVQGIRWGWEPWAAPWFGRLADRYGRRRLFVGALLAAGILFGLMIAPIAFAPWIAILLSIQLTATILTTVMDTLAADEASRQANSTVLMTYYSVTTDLGAAVGPLAAFWMDGHAGLPVLYGGIAVMLFALGLGWSRSRGNPVTVGKKQAI